MNQREEVKRYEEQVAEYLKMHGFMLLAQNFRCRQGEVDLIGIHEECLVFVEVKYRKNSSVGMPEEAVNTLKQQRICRVSDYYRLTHPWESERQIRYDVVAICGDQFLWHKNAFVYQQKSGKYSW